MKTNHQYKNTPLGKIILVFLSLLLTMTDLATAQKGTTGIVESNLGLCVDGKLVSQTNTSCGGNTGSVTFEVDTFTLAMSCCPNITSIKAILLSGFNRIDSATTDIMNIAIPITFVNLAAGSYGLRVEGYEGTTNCALQQYGNFVTILSSGQITVDIPVPNIVMETCPGSMNGSFAISATGGVAPYTFSINSVPVQNKTGNQGELVSFTNLSGSVNYSITITDNSSCSVTTSTTVGILNPQGITVSKNITNVSCFNGNNGSAQLSASGGNSTSFTFNWSNGTPGPLAQNLVAGTYTVIVTGNSGCSKIESVVIAAPPMLQLNVTKTNITCNGLANGTATASASGGTGARTFRWSNDSITASITNLSPITYTVTVTDVNNCTATASVTITEPGTLSFTADPIPDPVQSGQQVQIILNGTNDIQSFSWEITSLVNLNPTPMSGSVNNSSGTVSIVKNLTVQTDRSHGAATFQIVPVFNSNCKGDTQYVNVTVLSSVNTDEDPFIPEIYTPNGDGQNDAWLVVMPDGVEKGEYTIFNRLGGKVYEGDTLTPWDGTGCPDGPYFYVLRYTQNGVEKVKKGAITILRTSN